MQMTLVPEGGYIRQNESVHEIETAGRVSVCSGIWPKTGNYGATGFLISDTNEIPNDH